MHIYFFDKKFSLLLLFFGAILLFFPKINLISLSAGETAGIRVDDLVLLLIASLIIWGHFILNEKILKIEGWIVLLTVFSFLSFISNQLLVEINVLHINAKIYYVFRLFEYFLFFYIGLIASRYRVGDQIIKMFFAWNIFLMILQKFHIMGAISSVGYHAEASSRVFGVASFPSEMGLILNLLFCYFIFFNKELPSKFLLLFSAHTRYFLQKLYVPFMFLLFGIFIVFTGNRISVLALFLCFLCKLKDEFNWRSIGSLIGLVVFSSVLIAGVVFVILKTKSVYERSASLISWNNLELAEILWDKIDLKGDALTQETDVDAGGYDMSWWIRMHKWVFMAKCFITHPQCYLQGLGPGFSGAALDGGVLRILTEYGIVGFYIFYRFFKCLYCINRQSKWMIIAFMTNMIFFDAYLAYKSMSVLLFITGYLKGNQEQENTNIIAQTPVRAL